MVIKDEQLYKECFEASKYKKTITFSHLPFKSGYYVTEYGIILMVIEPNIYRLETEGWVIAQNYFDLWYDSMTSFSDIPVSISRRLNLNDYEIINAPRSNDNAYIGIVDYFDRFRDEAVALLDELQAHITKLDTEHVQTHTSEYSQNYIDLILNEIYSNDGRVLLAVENQHAVGLIAGLIEAKDNVDILTTRCPKRGIIRELVVLPAKQNRGIGEKLIKELEKYFCKQSCEFIAVEVFAPNISAIKFYEQFGYTFRNIEMYKRTGDHE